MPISVAPNFGSVSPIAQAGYVTGAGNLARFNRQQSLAEEEVRQRERLEAARLGEARRHQLTGIAANEVMQGQQFAENARQQDRDFAGRTDLANLQFAENARHQDRDFAGRTDLANLQFGENQRAREFEFGAEQALQNDRLSVALQQTQYGIAGGIMQSQMQAQANLQAQQMQEYGATYRQWMGGQQQLAQNYQRAQLDDVLAQRQQQYELLFQNKQYNQLEQKKAQEVQRKMMAVDQAVARGDITDFQGSNLKLQLQTQMPIPSADRPYSRGQEPGQYWQATGADGQPMLDGSGMPIMLHRKPDGSVVPLWKPAPPQQNQQAELEFRQKEFEQKFQQEQQLQELKKRQAFQDAFVKFYQNRFTEDKNGNLVPPKMDETMKEFQQIWSFYDQMNPAQGGGLPVVGSPAEASRLPPGTQFRTPDGRTMRVPMK